MNLTTEEREFYVKATSLNMKLYLIAYLIACQRIGIANLKGLLVTGSETADTSPNV